MRRGAMNSEEERQLSAELERLKQEHRCARASSYGIDDPRGHLQSVTVGRSRQQYWLACLMTVRMQLSRSLENRVGDGADMRVDAFEVARDIKMKQARAFLTASRTRRKMTLRGCKLREAKIIPFHRSACGTLLYYLK